MVRNSKVKLIPKKKKKKQKKPGKPRVRLLVGDIGIVSTIDLPPGWRKAFKDGFNDASVRLKVKRRETYKEAKLRRAIQAFNDDPDIGLIVTVGGLVVSKVADAVATRKPFLSLVGGDPANANPKFFGGVTLQSYKSNPSRIQLLVKKGFAANEIGLFYNPNSAMSGEETAEWTGAAPVACTVDANRDVDPATYPNDLSRFPASVKAVVISADPFFTETMNELVDAANRSGRQHICYPLQDYADATPVPDAAMTTFFGPALTSAYRLLGVLSRIARDTGTKLNPLLVAVPDEQRLGCGAVN